MPRKKQKKSALPKHVRAHGSGFRGIVTTNGERTRSRTYSTVEEVEKWLSMVLANRDAIADLPVSMSLGDCLATLRTELREIDATEGTMEFYETHASTVINGLGGDEARIDMLTPRQVQGFVNARRQKGVKGATIVGKELMVLRRFLKIARAAGVALPVDCLSGLRTPKVQTKRFGYLTVRQVADAVQSMRAAGESFWADITELLFQTGLRRAELVRLRVKDIDLEQRHIAVRGKMRDRNQVFGSAMTPLLKRLIAGAYPDGRIVESQAKVADNFTKWRRRLGLVDFSPHVLRHSYATDMAPRVDPWKLMKLMDHGSLKQTETYYHSTDDGMRDALDGLARDLQAPPPSSSKQQQGPE